MSEPDSFDKPFFFFRLGNPCFVRVCFDCTPTFGGCQRPSVLFLKIIMPVELRGIGASVKGVSDGVVYLDTWKWVFRYTVGTTYLERMGG